MKGRAGDSGVPKEFLVLGVGSILMKDEGVGVWAVEELGRCYRFPENVELVDGGTSGLDLLPFIAGRQFLLIIDAIQGNMLPGTVMKVEGDDVSARFRTRISPHQLGISDLLATASLTNELPGEILLLGIEPKTMEMGLGLSDEVKAGLERLCEAVVAELTNRGCAVLSLAEGEQTAPECLWGRP